MIDCRSVQRSIIAPVDGSESRSCWSIGSRAFLARSGVMIIEKGQETIVASGSMASIATIENPDEGDDTVVSTYLCSVCVCKQVTPTGMAWPAS